MHKKGFTILALFFLFTAAAAQDTYELNTDWKCINFSKLSAGGEKISQPSYSTKDWMPATVPGTVLTTLINNKLMPDPFYGMNNQRIPDIYKTDRDYYTYWFVRDFTEAAP
ncbi:MAG TPA: hypothetical protein VHC48_04655, partial [Puia sp.]|nr:hypothetical protein [Puia sp.]